MKIIIIHKSLTERLIGFVVSWSFLCGSIWFNYTFIGGSYFMNGIILTSIIIWAVIQPSSNSFTTKEEAIKYIQNMETGK